MARLPCVVLQRCKCVDIHRSGERASSGPTKGATEAVPTGPTKGSQQNFLYFAFCCEPFVGPVGTASVAPFVGPDDSLSPLRWMSTHLHRCWTTQGSLADSFLLLSQHFIFMQLYHYLDSSKEKTFNKSRWRRSNRSRHTSTLQMASLLMHTTTT